MTKFSETPLIHPTAKVSNSQIGKYTEIADRCRIHESAIGDYSYLMEDCGAWCAEIGKFANIAACVRINATNHPMHRPSQHHFTYRSPDYWPETDLDKTIFDWRRAHRVSIGHDTWIGHGAIILPGVTVGDGAVIGSGSVVTKDVDPYTVVAGVAAKPINRRFSVSISERLQALQWWDWSHEKLRDCLADFRVMDVESFLEKHETTA
ncbi:MAG: DapH/DapD/GlmU-related protein [Pseudomonadota bacterium]